MQRLGNSITRVEVCLTRDHYPIFLKAFGKGQEDTAPASSNGGGSGSVELAADEIEALQQDRESDDCFR